MMFSIEFSQKATKTIGKLEFQDQEQILKKLQEIRESPFSHLKKLSVSKLWRLRVGKFHLIIDVIIKGNRIIVLKVDKRERVY